MRNALVASTVLGMLILAACGGSPDPPEERPAGHSIDSAALPGIPVLANDGVEITVMEVEFGSRPTSIDRDANLRVRIRIGCHRADPFEVPPPIDVSLAMEDPPDLTCEVPYERFVVTGRVDTEFTEGWREEAYPGRRVAYGWREPIILFDEWVQVRELAFFVARSIGPQMRLPLDDGDAYTPQYDRDFVLVYRPGLESYDEIRFFKLGNFPQTES